MMKNDKNYLDLMKLLNINDIDIGEFKKAFDVTRIEHALSYVNQKYVSIGQRALHLVYADLYFCDDLNQVFEILDSFERMLEISERYHLNEYVYSKNGDEITTGFIIRSTLFYAISGIVFLQKGYMYLKKWYQKFVYSYETNMELIEKKVGII